MELNKDKKENGKVKSSAKEFKGCEVTDRKATMKRERKLKKVQNL